MNEDLILTNVEHFRRQFHHLYPDRKPLFLSPLNEDRFPKFVCTTIRPTALPYADLIEWNSIAPFLADHLNYDLLSAADQLPKEFFSPKKILSDQHGHCFDYANLLCSLLIGAGYDAFIVHGYATREITLMDTTRMNYPFLRSEQTIDAIMNRSRCRKYPIKPEKTFVSKYDQYMHRRYLDRLEKDREQNERDEQQRIAEIERPIQDPLEGLRIHAWVLILAGKRDVTEGFFLEPNTGVRKSLDDRDYLGIESVWNHRNFWLNMQDCSHGCQSLQYDLNDRRRWEPIFTDENDSGLPSSWVDRLNILPKNFHRRYPNGYKRNFLKKTIVEKYAPYSMKDGLILKISVYADYFYDQLISMIFSYEHRHDKLDRRHYDVQKNVVNEIYRPGRNDKLKEYVYNLGEEFRHTMIYYHKSRLDGLSRRDETSRELTDFYLDRDDRLHYRQTIFEHRKIVSITEKFHRNETLNANDDIEQLVYAIEDHRFHLTYHRHPDHISASTRTFRKPLKTSEWKWTDDLEETFQADEDFPVPSKRELYYQLLRLIEQEMKIIEEVQHAQDEIRHLLLSRQKEEIGSDLDVSLDDVERNQKSKIYRQLLENKAKDDKGQSTDTIDYLAPFLVAMGNPDRLTKSLAEQLRHQVLQSFRDRYSRQANAMQFHYEENLEKLVQNHQWFETRSIDCEKAQFHLEIVSERLQRHIRMSQEKLIELEEQLNNDNRLKELYIVR